MQSDQAPMSVRLRPRCLFALGDLAVGCLKEAGICLRDRRTGVRLHLGDIDEKELDVRCQIVEVNADERLVFVGYRNSRKYKSLRVWRYSANDSACTPIELRITNGMTALPGFCLAVQSKDNSSAVFFTTGLGKGVARVWALNVVDGTVDLVTSCKAKFPSVCSAIALPNEGKVLIASWADANTRIIQEWAFSPNLHQIELTGKDAAVVSKREIGSRNLPFAEFEEDVLFVDYRFEAVLEYVKDMPAFSDLFPLSVVQPSAYIGDKDGENRPHGLGKRQVDENYVFEGQWEHGLPIHGTIKHKNGLHVYEGDVQGDDAIAHGFGKERRPLDSGFEIYSGGWQEGLRHGLFITYYEGMHPTKSKYYGTKHVGFYFQGKRHGLAWHEWSPDAPEFPFALGKEAEARSLGPVRCIQLYRQGKLLDEFNFSMPRSGQAWSETKKALLNIPEMSSGPPSFAERRHKRACGRNDRDECWACLEDTSEEPLSSVITCSGCSMRVHSTCAYPNQAFEKKGLNGRIWTCPMCEPAFAREDKLVIAFDRHGEPVVVEDDNEDLLEGGLSNKATREPRVLYTIHYSAS